MTGTFILKTHSTIPDLDLFSMRMVCVFIIALAKLYLAQHIRFVLRTMMKAEKKRTQRKVSLLVSFSVKQAQLFIFLAIRFVIFFLKIFNFQYAKITIFSKSQPCLKRDI